jgi:predicted RNA binding protein YcfA (HicA-like mRNA interferase family)
MKGELPSLKPKELLAVLIKVGFQVKRQTGSHVILFKPGIPRPISIPMHVKDLPKGTCRAIIRQTNLTLDEFSELLEK